MKSILIVDNAPTVRRIKAITGRMSINLIEAGSIKEALNKLIVHESIIDLVIIDVMMEEYEKSFDFIKTVKKKIPSAPIIVLSASLSKPVLVNTLRLKVADIVVKPFDDETVESKIFAHLKSRDKSLDRTIDSDHDQIRKVLRQEIFKSKKGDYPITIMMAVFYNPEETQSWERIKKHNIISERFTDQMKSVFNEMDTLFTYESNTLLAIIPFCSFIKRNIVKNKIIRGSKDVLEAIGQPNSQFALTMRTFPEETIYGFDAEVKMIETMMGEIDELVRTKRISKN